MDHATSLFGRCLVTRQTGSAGKPVRRLYVEAATGIARELYFGIVLDRSTERVTLVASAEGGMEIEELSAARPGALIRVPVEPAAGLLDFQAREIAFAMRLGSAQIARAVRVFRGAYRAFRDLDLTLLEINPLGVTHDGGLVALDATMSFDDSALFRHPDIVELRDRSQEDARESRTSSTSVAARPPSGY